MGSDKQALVVIDVQDSIFKLPVPTHESERFLSRIEELLSRARKAAVPVVFIQHCGPKGGPFEKGSTGWGIHSRLARKDTESVIEKSEPDAFQCSDLDRTLKSFGVTEIVICGFATPLCVDTTVRSAYARGYKVVLASDAHTTTDNDILSAKLTIEFANWVLSRFAKIERAEDVRFLPA